MFSTLDKADIVKTTVNAALSIARTQQHCISHCIRGFSICSALQDLSRPSASSSASLARMIGGLALAGVTANITDQPPSPKPARRVPLQSYGSSQGPQSGSPGVTADGAQELWHQVSGAGGAAAGPNGQGPDSQDQDQAGTSGGSRGRHARQGNAAGAMGQPGAAPASHRPAALGQDDAAPAAGMSNSTVAGAAASSHMSAWSNSGMHVVDGDEKGGYSSSNAAAGSPARQDPTGSTASGMGSQDAPAGPSSIAAYRPEVRAGDGGAWSGLGAVVGIGVGVAGQGQGGPTGLDLDESLRRQSFAGEKSYQSGGGHLDAERRTKPSGQPIQVRLCLHVQTGILPCQCSCKGCDESDLHQLPRLLLVVPVMKVLSMNIVQADVRHVSQIFNHAFVCCVSYLGS